ncbi:superoxide dismutase [Novosphingobium lentum]|uniref:superoxide dismutase n=1 Tax=Novosphingobium lentum TaxID=145287 RepID=UPI0008371C81|nr:superoxide dismutase [Novosphingobium lentum]
MPIKLLPLPYAEDALAPAISTETLRTHHGKHHKAYVDKTTAAIAGGDLADASLEQIIAAAKAKDDRKLFNNAAQAWNHGFYWMSLSPKVQAPSGDLATAIDASFGSLEALHTEIATQGADHFASGWVWLVAHGAKLAVEQTHDAATFATGDANPLLVIDLWEHAYYLDHKNLRPDYLKAVIAQHLAWDFAAENMARGSAWTYPA